MLSAESVALQARLVQQLASLRKQELDYIIQQYQSLGMQSALICSFIIGNWQNTYAVQDPNFEGFGIWFHVTVRLFFFCTYAAILASIVTVILTMLVSNWAPGVALRGDPGSMTRALNAARAQSAIIQQLFISSIVGFGLQLFCATWLITFAEDSAHDIIDAVLSTSLMIACGMYALRHAVRMDRDFHGEETQWAKWADVPFAPHALWAFVKELRASQQSRRESTRTPTPFGKVNKHLDSPGQDDKLRPLMSAVDHRLDNPLGLVEAHPDLAVAGSASVRSMKEPQDLVRPAICELQGPLRKRVSHAGLGLVDPHQWRDRYFVLSEGSLLYWPTEADFNHFIGGLDPNDSRGAARLSARLGRSSVYSGSVPEGRATQSLGEGSNPDSSFKKRAASIVERASSVATRSKDALHPLEPERIPLASYKVVVDMYDFNHGFYLQRREEASTSDGARHSWQFRAPSDEMRLAWTEKLTLACKWAAAN